MSNPTAMTCANCHRESCPATRQHWTGSDAFEAVADCERARALRAEARAEAAEGERDLAHRYIERTEAAQEERREAHAAEAAMADGLADALRLERANVEQIDAVVRQMEQSASVVAHGWASKLREWVDGAMRAGGDGAVAGWRTARGR